MRRKRSPFALPASWNWLTRPLLALAGAVMVVITWLEEAFLFLGDLLSIIALPVISSVIFLFNHIVFRRARPTKNDRSG